MSKKKYEDNRAQQSHEPEVSAELIKKARAKAKKKLPSLEDVKFAPYYHTPPAQIANADGELPLPSSAIFFGRLDEKTGLPIRTDRVAKLLKREKIDFDRSPGDSIISVVGKENVKKLIRADVEFHPFSDRHKEMRGSLKKER